MKTNALLILALVTFSLAGKAQVGSPHKITIDLEKRYAEKINPALKHRIDSVVHATVDRFNTQSRFCQLAATNDAQGESITLDFTQARLVTKRNRTVAYLVSIIAPVYVPMHKIKSTVTPSDGLLVRREKCEELNSRTGVMLANMKKREEKLLVKYSEKLLEELLLIDRELSASSITSSSKSYK